MKKDNPLVSIVLAMYKPNLIWLREQLQSLNTQDYDNLELLVWNDCPGSDNNDNLFKECITKYPYKIFSGEKNLGSTGAFQKLTELAKGDYIAYCDQDDIWKKIKLSTLKYEFDADSNLTLACSDMSAIDGKGNKLANHIREIYKRQVPYEEPDLVKTLLSRCFITGCTILIRTSSAKKALPFPEHMVHDYWLGIHEAIYGKVKYVHKPLIRYRVHGDNQTAILAGISTKIDYYERRICSYYDRIYELRYRVADSSFEPLINDALKWGRRRENYFNKPGIETFFDLLLCFFINWRINIFELMLPFMPNCLFKYLIKKVKQGKL